MFTTGLILAAAIVVFIFYFLLFRVPQSECMIPGMYDEPAHLRVIYHLSSVACHTEGTYFGTCLSPTNRSTARSSFGSRSPIYRRTNLVLLVDVEPFLARWVHAALKETRDKATPQPTGQYVRA